MKGFFLAVLGLLLAVAIVRFSYGLDPNSSEYFLQVILDLPPDIRGEFEIVIDAGEAFSKSLSALERISSSGGDILDVVKSFFESVAAFLNIPFAFVEFLLAMVGQLLESLRALFNLLFGPAVVPIE